MCPPFRMPCPKALDVQILKLLVRVGERRKIPTICKLNSSEFKGLYMEMNMGLSVQCVSRSQHCRAERVALFCISKVSN